MHCPPSTLIVWPVMLRARSDAKNTTAAAISDASCQRPSGATASHFLAPHASYESVLDGEGATPHLPNGAIHGSRNHSWCHHVDADPMGREIFCCTLAEIDDACFRRTVRRIGRRSNLPCNRGYKAKRTALCRSHQRAKCVSHVYYRNKVHIQDTMPISWIQIPKRKSKFSR